ncbi:MAG: hypothetical protein JWL64_2365, partial [Frankiales bacterium]|nr:hypothetical protein [Frankiales bacterium]
MSTVEGVGVQELGPTGSDQDGEVSVLAPGDIERLQAFDGLFLRAEHLNLIQDYAAKLAMSVGAAGGPGVVEGYDVVLKQGELAVGPGLAIDPSGRPLLSRAEVTLPLGGLQPGLDTFWYVEAVGDGEPTGNEPVQGLLCDEPCDGGTTRAPVLAERVRIRLTRAVEPDLTTWTDDQKRSRLTSRLFATEQRRAGAWSRVPGDPGAGLADRSWLPARAASGRDPAVRLGVLIPDGDLQKWQVDVWAVRRDRGDPPPTRLWQWRLGMRPWDVFVAQVLQFQHMFGLVDVTTLTDSVLAQLDAIAAIIP